MGQKVKLYNITNGADTPIIALTFARGLEIEEDGTGAQAGFKLTFPNGDVGSYIPSEQPFKLGAENRGLGPLIGQPADHGTYGNPATIYCTARSLGANTVLRVTEIN